MTHIWRRALSDFAMSGSVRGCVRATVLPPLYWAPNMICEVVKCFVRRFVWCVEGLCCVEGGGLFGGAYISFIYSWNPCLKCGLCRVFSCLIPPLFRCVWQTGGSEAFRSLIDDWSLGSAEPNLLPYKYVELVSGGMEWSLVIGTLTEIGKDRISMKQRTVEDCLVAVMHFFQTASNDWCPSS